VDTFVQETFENVPVQLDKHTLILDYYVIYLTEIRLLLCSLLFVSQLIVVVAINGSAQLINITFMVMIIVVIPLFCAIAFLYRLCHLDLLGYPGLQSAHLQENPGVGLSAFSLATIQGLTVTGSDIVALPFPMSDKVFCMKFQKFFSNACAL
jgi:hypothetical protein